MLVLSLSSYSNLSGSHKTSSGDWPRVTRDSAGGLGKDDKVEVGHMKVLAPLVPACNLLDGNQVAHHATQDHDSRPC